MTLEEIKKILPTIPESPGCYQYFDSNGAIIYVGKAKNLRKRVSTYFQKDHIDVKTRILVRKICDLKYTVVNTEFDALILENSLIKQYQPRYNILLKDGKTYPSIVIKKEPFPRIFVTRDIRDDGSEYFGPYPSAQMAYSTLDMIRELYPLRTCKLNLSPDKIRTSNYKVCLQYHIKKCLGPCEGLQSQADYNKNILEIKQLLRGKLRDVIELYKKEMYRLSEEMEYEMAQIYKERLDYLEKYQSKHTVAPGNIYNVDVFSYESDDSNVYINYMHVYQGLINKAFTVEYKLSIEEEPSEVLATAITELRSRFESDAKEIIVPFAVNWDTEPGVTMTIPLRGDKKKLLDLSSLNVKQYKADKYKQTERLNPEQRSTKILKELQTTIGLIKMPVHIECFDNSNIQGSTPVAACVVFKKAKPSKKDYRKFHVKTVEGANDYDSMREIVQRRYKRLKEDNSSMPDLILADGGKGQMNAIRNTLDTLDLNIPVAGLVKDERHKTDGLLYGNPIQEVFIDHKSELFLFLEYIQSEVHRFAISFHRDIRSKGQVSSKLDYIKGIGPKTKDQLLSTFKSVQRLTKATEEEIIAVAGKAKGQIIYKALHQETEDKA
ncbi:excinuclease ABC subunit UvrC [Porphyromonas pogonae]|uniref:excinuclease ABC subunit UvrC n=1 Tax=Porphyromonas pogonae TaxID=867595 RepID=UPI002E769584|nr:excinuclease ABC subunit UvrC [Porphyromonas pogonae]